MFNGSRLTLARKRRQHTKKELAEKAHLTAITLTRLEAGETPEPGSDTVRSLAQALNYPTEFFYLSDSEPLQTEAVSFRSLSTLSARQRDAALAAGELAFELHGWVTLRFDLPPSQLLDLREEEPMAAAETLRTHWGIGTRPIEHLIKLLESKGVRVFCLAEQHRHVDAFSCWREQVPYIFLNTYKSAERSRFDAAHVSTQAARQPVVLTQTVEHGAADALHGIGFELRPQPFLVAAHGVEQTQHSILDDVFDLNTGRKLGHKVISDALDQRRVVLGELVAVQCSGCGIHIESSASAGCAVRPPAPKPNPGKGTRRQVAFR